MEGEAHIHGSPVLERLRHTSVKELDTKVIQNCAVNPGRVRGRDCIHSR